MKRKYLLYSVLWLGFISCISEEDISGLGHVEGKVLDEASVSIANASVRISGNSFNHKMNTDSKGIFSFEEVPSGDNYMVVASHPDYENDTKYTTVFPLSKDGPVQLQVFKLVHLPVLLVSGQV